MTLIVFYFFASFFQEPNRIHLVLPRCNDNFFSHSHLLRLFIFFYKTWSILLMFFPVTARAESSAYQYIKSQSSSIAPFMSFTYNKNKRGPKIEPCGTPQLILSVDDLVPLPSTYWPLDDKYILNHDTEESLPQQKACRAGSYDLLCWKPSADPGVTDP